MVMASRTRGLSISVSCRFSPESYSSSLLTHGLAIVPAHWKVTDYTDSGSDCVVLEQPFEGWFQKIVWLSIETIDSEHGISPWKNREHERVGISHCILLGHQNWRLVNTRGSQNCMCIYILRRTFWDHGWIPSPLTEFWFELGRAWRCAFIISSWRCWGSCSGTTVGESLANRHVLYWSIEMDVHDFLVSPRTLVCMNSENGGTCLLCLELTLIW